MNIYDKVAELIQASLGSDLKYESSGSNMHCVPVS